MHERRLHHRFPANAAAWGLALALVAGLTLRAVLLTTSATVLQPSTDESIQLLLAQSIRAGATPLLFLAQPYLFPLESYLMAPFANVLPASAWGARLPVWILHLAALALLLRFLWQTIPHTGARFCGAALLLLPSSYVLLVQGAYSMPGYASMLLGGVAAFACAAEAGRRPDRVRWLFFIGFLGGLGYASHQLVLVFILPAALFAFLLQPRIARMIPLAGGALLGLTPYVLAIWRFPGAHNTAEQLAAVESMLRRLWTPALTHTLPGAMGWRVPLFPDQTALPAGSPLVERAWPWLFTAVLIACFISFIASRLARIRREGVPVRRAWLHVELRDLAWMAVLLNILFFAASGRADSSSYRYLLPAAILFPILVADIIARMPRARIPGYAAVVVLLLVNIAAARTLLAAWRAPDFAERIANIPDLSPALDYLRAQSISHAIASHGAAYRINVQSGGAVVCAQPYNERFPNWPIPYEDRVWRGERIAYVLTDRIRFLRPHIFERHLETMGIGATVHTAGAFRVFHDFVSRIETHPAVRLRNETIQVAASPGAQPTSHLLDANPSTIWTTTNTMRGGEWIEARWTEPLPVERVVLVHGRYHQDAPTRYTVQLYGADGWQAWEAPQTEELDKFEIERGHPRYGRSTRTFRLEGRVARGIRFEVDVPRTNRNWSVAEIEVYVRDPAPVP